MHDVLANGARIPAIGFGTYGTVRAEMLRTLPAALKAGFRHVDTAQIYRNEMDVGECVASSGVPRSEIFLTTKAWVANYPADRFAFSTSNWAKAKWPPFRRSQIRTAASSVRRDWPRPGIHRREVPP
jgi:2,5-diketo-D-gluconate reductase B